MKKTEVRILTTKDYKFIPWNIIIIRDADGWVYCAKKGVQWYVNSTQDNKDGLELEEKFIKRLIKALKEQIKNA